MKSNGMLGFRWLGALAVVSGVLLAGANGCGSDLAEAPAGSGGGANGSDGGDDCFGSCEELGGGEPNFTDGPSCVAYLETLDMRGDDVDGDFIPDGDDDPSNDGLDDWGRPILDDETRCGCENAECLQKGLDCQANTGCREIATCALNAGCRSIRECFWGDGWPGGEGPCNAVINKWGAQSTASALGEEISRCQIREMCPARKCPCAPGDAACPTREEMTCAFTGLVP